MWIRAVLKERAKVAFKANYWRCVFVSLVIALLTGVGAGSSSVGAASSAATGQDLESAVNDLKSMVKGGSNVAMAALLVIIGVLAVASIIGTLIQIFAKNVFLIGTDAFYLKNTSEAATADTLLIGFKNGAYFRNVGAMFLMYLFIALGSMFCIIPGIIVALMLRMVPYILTEHPELGAMDALKESARIMKGHKWNAFVLDLSFIGWDILVALTCGILGIFYVHPYKDATNAELYRAITYRPEEQNS